ncbi:MAG: hypothetical protein NZ899_10930 [Thermoguttaceae bacterium]|nr:hypothetical protein [Thermoguttaceae bacterium]MDW8079162.1 hypothetical protein [Thermoguttaceae bacterium]
MPFLAEVGNAALALTTALVITVGLILWQTQRQWRQGLRRPRWLEESESWTGPPAVTEEDLARWEVRLHELARDIQGELNSKMAILAELVARAEHLAQRLESLLGADTLPADSKSGAARISDDPPEGPPPQRGRILDDPTVGKSQGPNEAASCLNKGAICEQNARHFALPSSSGQEVPRSAYGLKTWHGINDHDEAVTPANTPGKTTGLASGEIEPSGHRPEGTSRFAQVYELLAAGLSPQEVANQTGLAVGEVELALRVLRLRGT